MAVHCHIFLCKNLALQKQSHDSFMETTDLDDLSLKVAISQEGFSILSHCQKIELVDFFVSAMKIISFGFIKMRSY